MADDDAVCVLYAAHQFDAALGDEAVRRAMEAVAAQMVFGVILGGNGIAVCLRGHGHMERGVEHGDLRLARHGLFACFNAHEVGGIVQRAEGDAVADGLLAGLVDDAAFNKLVAAMQNTMADSVDLIDGFDHTVFRIDQNGHNGLDRLLVRRHRNVLFILLAAGRDLVGQTAVQTDALTQPLGGDVAGVRVHELVLEAGAASIDNQNVHTSIHSCISFFNHSCYYIT